MVGLLGDDRATHLKAVRDRLAKFMLPAEIDGVESLIHKILDIKEQKNVIVLGHNYMTPDVYYGVSDFVGDSLGLARHAAETDADIILFNGVHFMAETAKILNPQKKVLIADPKAGCSLSEGITGADVRRLREEHPGVPVVTYINCSAEVKAECDIVCTSANAVKVVNSFAEDQVIMVPDGYLAANVQKETDKEIIIWAGKCMVHELFSATDVELARRNYPKMSIIAHPECKPEVTDLVDYTGSTSQMAAYIKDKGAKQVMLMTECSMGDNLQGEFPKVEFISTCQTCPHMKRITLEKILASLENEQFEVEVPADVAQRAKQSLDRMLEIGR